MQLNLCIGIYTKLKFIELRRKRVLHPNYSPTGGKAAQRGQQCAP